MNIIYITINHPEIDTTVNELMNRKIEIGVAT